jgi:membrane protein
VAPAAHAPLERVKATRAALTERAEEARERLEASRERSRAIDAVLATVERDAETGGGVLAAAVGFRAFLFMVPYVFTLVAGLGLAADASDVAPDDAARKAGIGGLTAKAIANTGNASLTGRITAFVIGAFALFLAARSMVKVLRIVHALVWNVPLAKLKKPTRAALFFVGVVTVALLLASLVGWLRDQSFLSGVLGIALFVFVPTLIWLYISWLLPREECAWTELIPGALCFGVGLWLLHLVTVTWIAHQMSAKSETYGAIGAALALLLWAYLLGRLVTTSAVLNEVFWRRRRARSQTVQA